MKWLFIIGSINGFVFYYADASNWNTGVLIIFGALHFLALLAAMAYCYSTFSEQGNAIAYILFLAILGPIALLVLGYITPRLKK